MPRLPGRIRRFGSGGLLLALAAPFAAQPASGAAKGAAEFALEYAAHAACPDSRAFVRQVVARSLRAELVRVGASPRTLSVAIVRDGALTRGTLRVHSPPEPSSERTIHAQDCAEVVAGLALVAALALDPDARTEPLDAARLDDPDVERRSAVDDHPPSESARLAAPEPRVRTPRPEPDRAPAASRGSALSWSWDAGIALEAVRGVAPGWLLAPRVHAGLELWPERLLSPAVRLSAAAGTRSFEHSLTSAALSWRAARLEGCPIRILAVRSTSLRPCVFFDAGDLTGEAQASESVTPRRASRPWYAVGVLGRAVWSPTRPLGVHAQIGLTAPLVRDNFGLASTESDDLVSLHDVPAFGALAAVGARVEFR